MNNKYESAKRTLESLGYTFKGGKYWKPPIGDLKKFQAIASTSDIAERLDEAKKNSYPCSVSKGEWPAVGDKVLTASNQEARIIAIDSTEVWVKYESSAIGQGYATVSVATLSKPPTPEEILKEKLIYLTDKYRNQGLSVQEIISKAIINGEIEGLGYSE